VRAGTSPTRRSIPQRQAAGRQSRRGRPGRLSTLPVAGAGWVSIAAIASRPARTSAMSICCRSRPAIAVVVAASASITAAGDSPRSFTACRSAPASSSTAAAPVRPRNAAACNGVLPPRDLASTSAPCAINARAASCCPVTAAQPSGVWPNTGSGASMSTAGSAAKRRTASTSPNAAACQISRPPASSP
jgi:hypothetical protein